MIWLTRGRKLMLLVRLLKYLNVRASQSLSKTNTNTVIFEEFEFRHGTNLLGDFVVNFLRCLHQC